MDSSHRLPIERQILDLLMQGASLTARDIARRLEADLPVVNRYLYGPLASKVRRNSSYQWSLDPLANRRPRDKSPKRVKAVDAVDGRADSPVIRRGPRPCSVTLRQGSIKLWSSLQVLASGTSHGLNLTQILMLLRIAEAGDQGVDAAELADATGASAASVSRTVRILGAVHYCKKREGFGLVDLQFDPTDNRKRVIRLTPDGAVLMNEIVANL